VGEVAGRLGVPVSGVQQGAGSERGHPKASLRSRRQGDGTLRQLLPDPIPGMPNPGRDTAIGYSVVLLTRAS
jgi:hypothetical protein